MARENRWPDALREVAPLLSLGIQLALIVLVGVGIGWWLDQRFGVAPWGILGGSAFGIGSGFYHFFRAVLAIGEGKGLVETMNPEHSVNRVTALWGRWFAGLTAGSGLLAAYPISQLSPLETSSVLIGWGVSFAVCATSGFLAFWSLNRAHNTFLLVALGGIVGRLAVMAGAVFVGVAIAGLHPMSFLVALLTSYTIYHGLEVIMLNRSKAVKASSQRTTDNTPSNGVER